MENLGHVIPRNNGKSNMSQTMNLLMDIATNNGPMSESLRFDMHLHSRRSSDSAIPVQSLVKCFERSGILPLVCDHNTLAGSIEVYDRICSAHPDIPRILAEEIMTSDGEIIGLFLEEEIPPFLSAEETLDRIRDQGALSIVPHPFCSYRPGALTFYALDRIIDRVDIVEGFNARVIDDRDNLTAREYAARHKKPVSAGSDAHTPLELGRTWLTVRPFFTPQELMRELPDAEVHYLRMHPSIHLVTRVVKAGRKMGFFCPS
jgi:predicted metal-dependent phosphoesterase TrpH